MSEHESSPAAAGDPLAGYLTTTLLELLGDAVTVISPDWRYLYVSARAAAIIGKPAAEVVGRGVWDVFPEVVGTPQHEAVLRAMRTRQRERVVWFFDSVNGWFEQHALPVADGLVVLVNDITEQRLAEWRAEQLVVLGEALAESGTPAEVNAVVCQHAFPLVGAAGGGLVVATSSTR
jgi:PAS domain S-box-containing protein